MFAILGAAIIKILAGGFYLGAAYQDIRSRRISNNLSLGILILALLRWLCFPRHDFILTAIAALIILSVAFVMFWRGYLGGGDVKLIFVTALLLGMPAAVVCLALTTIVGGIVALALLCFVSIRYLRQWRAVSSETEPMAMVLDGRELRLSFSQMLRAMSVPYGVAIASAAIWTLGFDVNW